jgi:hypothetical protein
MFAVMTSAAVLVFLPVRALQARAFTLPYARAWSAIAHAPADVVIVDPNGFWYGDDLVRNDPFLVNAPKVMNLNAMAPSDITALCAHHRVELFDASDGASFGLDRILWRPDARALSLRAIADTPPCGAHVVSRRLK